MAYDAADAGVHDVGGAVGHRSRVAAAAFPVYTQRVRRYSRPAMFDVFVAYGATGIGRRKMAGHTVAVMGRTPSSAVADRRSFLVAPDAGILLMAYGAILAVPGGAHSVTASSPGQVVAVGGIASVTFLAGSFVIMTSQAELQVSA